MGYVHECVFLGVYLVETERFESLCRKLLGIFISGRFILFYFIHKINKSNQQSASLSSGLQRHPRPLGPDKTYIYTDSLS